MSPLTQGLNYRSACDVCSNQTSIDVQLNVDGIVDFTKIHIVVQRIDIDIFAVWNDGIKASVNLILWSA